MKLFKKKDSSFYWHDFNVRGKRYRGSTKETNRKRAEKIAASALSQTIERRDPLDKKSPSLLEFSTRFLEWVESSALAKQSKKYDHYGWHLLSTTRIVATPMDRITKDDVEALGLPGSAASANCAFRTLRRILHKAEEWNLIGKVPKFKLLREHGRTLRLDEEAEQRLLIAAEACAWSRRNSELFRDMIILARDTGMRNQRELYPIRIENLDWKNRIIFVPDSKTPDGRRMIPMSDRVWEVLRIRIGERREGWLFPSKRSKCGHLTDIGKQFRAARVKAGLPCTDEDWEFTRGTMGHKDVRAAMHYQHPDLEIVRAALNQGSELSLKTSA